MPYWPRAFKLNFEGSEREWRALERLLAYRESLPAWAENVDLLDDDQARGLACRLALVGWLSIPPPEPACDPIA